MIVENPYTQPHYLTTYFPIKPALIDKDRSRNGDYYKKPTQYWFINCKPEQNVLMEPVNTVNRFTIANVNTVNRETLRSMINPQYARRFIIHHIIDYEGGVFNG
jgi:hypothetical protein